MPQPERRFDYTTVPLRDGQVRIFRLLPPCATPAGTPEIRGDMFTTSIATPCKFTALSYTWGDGKDQADIEINGIIHTITSSLEVTLRGLRLQDSPLDLWIDQICINQKDVAEKDRQVPLMKSIYTLSTQTIGWLGESSPSAEKAIRYMERIGQYMLGFGFTKMTRELQEQLLATEEIEGVGMVTIPESVQGLKQSIADLIETEGEWHRLEVLNDLDELFGRRYFTRGWIKQEVALPPNLIFRCDDLAIDGDVLYAAFRFHDLHWRHSSRVSRKYLMGAAERTPKVQEMLDRFLEDRPGVDAANTSLVLRARQQLDVQDRSSTTLGNILRRYFSKSLYSSGKGREPIPAFTEEKDIIYGFLGVASDASSLKILTRYGDSVPVTTVYTEATKRIIETGDVDFLFLAHRTAPHPELPSWVPDLRSICDAPILTARTASSTKPFAAGTSCQQSHQGTPASSVEPDVLALQGIRIGVIITVGSEWPRDENGKRGRQQSIHPLASIEMLVVRSLGMGQNLTHHPLWATEEQRTRRSEASWRVPIADHEYLHDTRWHSRRATAEMSKAGHENFCTAIGRGYQLYVMNQPLDVVLPFSEEELKSLEGLEGEELTNRRIKLRFSKLEIDKLGTNYSGALYVLETRRGFLGEDGIVGIGPLEMAVGDVVCVLFGAQLPVVLRPWGNGLYSYVGDVYCDGIMDGEALGWGRESELFHLR